MPTDAEAATEAAEAVITVAEAVTEAASLLTSLKFQQTELPEATLQVHQDTARLKLRKLLLKKNNFHKKKIHRK